MTTMDHLVIPEHLQARWSAKRRGRWIQLVASLIAIGCVVLAGMQLGPLNAIRKDMQLIIDPDDIRGVPPDIAVMTKMGTLRLLAMDVAFARMERLKEEGKFYELMQLSNAVCKLAPRYASVWQYAAWNMAYNISVSEYHPEARWKWVTNGIELLRDQGIPYNPKSIGLYKELAWIYWHKVADYSDDAHFVYKAHVAVEMERILGAPSPALTEEQMIDAIRVIAEAPRKVEALIGQDAEVASLVERLAQVGLEPSALLLDFVAQHMRSEIQLSELLAETQDEEPDAIRRRSRLAVLSDAASKPAAERLLAAVRHQTLRDKLHLDPEWMLALMEKYGPLDWRSPYSLTLYWASKGDMVTKGQLNLDPSDSMNTVRYIFFALTSSIERGRITLEPNFENPGRSFVDMLPDTRFIPHLFDAFLELGAEQYSDMPGFIEGTPGPNYWAGFVNWLHDAIRMLVFEGGQRNRVLAQEYYTYLRRMHTEDDGSPREVYLKSLEDFVMSVIKDQLITLKKSSATVTQLLTRSLRELSLGRQDISKGFVERAAIVWRRYMADNVGLRNTLEPLNIMRRDAIVVFMQSPVVPTAYKARLWDRLDEQARRMTYDALLPFITELCASGDPPLSVEKFLPQPPGMEAYRETPETGRERIDDETHQGTKKFEP